jgi:hypothetical protein
MWIMADKVAAAGLGDEWLDVTRRRDQYIADLEARIVWLEETIARLVLAAETAAGAASAIAAKRELLKGVEQNCSGTVIELRGRLDRLA